MAGVRIGFVIYGAPGQLSGGYRYDRELAAGLERRGHRVDFIDLRSASDLVVETVDYDLLLLDELCHPDLHRIVDRFHPPTAAVVHHLAIDEKLSPGRGMLHRRMERRFLSSVNGILCNTSATRAAVEALIGSGPPLSVACPGREEQPFRGSPAIGTGTVLLSVGNLIPRKGIATVLRALEILEKKGELPVEFRYRIAGNDRADLRHAALLRRLVARYGLERRVEFTGRLTEQQLEDEFAAADIFCLPSQHEGFGIVYLEAMSTGCVVIGSSSGGAAEIISQGRNGFLVPPGRPRELVELLRQLLADASYRQQLGSAAFSSWETWPRWAESMAGGAVWLEELL